MIATEPTAKVLTYEDYMAEDAIMRRYDIVDGVRIYMTNPTIRHQDILLNIAEKLRAYVRSSKAGRVVVSPCDILITQAPLRTRQPDLLYISNERMGNRSIDDPAPLTPGPELVIEILSPSNTPRSLKNTILDYCAVGVLECWLISPEAETVEILRLALAGFEVAGVYAYEQTLQSAVLAELSLKVADIFP